MRPHRSLFFSIAWTLLCITFALSACKTFDREEPIPCYIHIDKINLQVTSSSQGSGSQGITDAWVYVDGKLIGAFEMPCTFPVLTTEGSHEVTVRGGIKMSGQTNIRIEYPFYDFYTTTATLLPGKITTISPTVQYLSATQFSFIEDFESVGTLFCPSNSDTTLNPISSPPADVFEGSKSGAAFVDASRSVFEVKTCSTYTFASNSFVYLELNYKCTNEFSIGIIANSQPLNATVVLAPTGGTWKKVYVNLSDDIQLVPNQNYAIYIHMLKASDVPVGELYLDNIKLVHF